jgi:alkylmercury lyase-like protein
MTKIGPDVPARVRAFVYEHFLEHAVPPVVERLMTDFSLSRESAGDVLEGLDAARHLALVKGTSRILMAWPFSAVATPFRVEVGGRRYFANCAWDAIAFHAMLRQDVRVESFCHHCAEPISLDLRGGRAVRTDPSEALVYLALPAARWWDDIITTCSNTMVFFASPEHRDGSTLCSIDAPGASLTPDETHTLSMPIYASRLALDYARPPRQELLDHFAGMGLAGDFWRL